MRSILITSVLSLITVVNPALNVSNDKCEFIVGFRQPGDEVIIRQIEKVRGAPDYVFNYSKTYVGNNHYVITRVVVKDESTAGGAFAAIIAGGPEHTFVTVAYTVPRYVQMNFNLTVYGKPPIFRKIP